MAERRNFYEMLDLDPLMDSWEEIGKVIDKQRNRWMMDRTHLNQARKQRAVEGLRYIDEMKQVLENPGRRRQEREVFLKQREENLAGKREELQKLIATIKGQGKGCSTDQFQMLVEKFSGFFTPLEIEKQLDAAGVRVGTETAPETSAWERKEFIEADLARDIALNLEIRKKNDLYAFLGVGDGAAAAGLFALAEQLYKESVRVGRTDEEATAEQKLAGICQTLFKSEDGKAKYDNYLRVLPLQELHDEIDLAGASRKLRQTELDDLARRSVRLGVPEADAYAYLLWYADKRSWEIVQPSPEEEMKEATEAARKAAAEIERQRREIEEERRREPPPPPPPEDMPTPSEPLSPPSGLHVEPRGNGFTLTWQPVSAAGESVSYCVVRKKGGPPEDEGDGDFVSDDLAGTHFDDTDVPRKTEWYYAAYAIRGDDVSLQAAVSGPHRIGGRNVWKLPLAAILLSGAIACGILVPGLVTPSKDVILPPEKVDLPPEKPPENKVLVNRNQSLKHQPPKHPRVTVVATGDKTMTSAIERYLGDELSRNFEMANRRTLPLADPSQALGVLSTLKTTDVNVLVHATVEHVSDRELNYLGRTSTATTSRLNVDVFLVDDQSGLGRGWSESFEHTAINVEGKVESTVIDIVNDVVDEIEGGWKGYRKSLGLTP
jgi:hypothetical protein